MPRSAPRARVRRHGVASRATSQCTSTCGAGPSGPTFTGALVVKDARHDAVAHVALRAWPDVVAARTSTIRSRSASWAARALGTCARAPALGPRGSQRHPFVQWRDHRTVAVQVRHRDQQKAPDASAALSSARHRRPVLGPAVVGRIDALTMTSAERAAAPTCSTSEASAATRTTPGTSGHCRCGETSVTSPTLPGQEGDGAPDRSA